MFPRLLLSSGVEVDVEVVVKAREPVVVAVEVVTLVRRFRSVQRKFMSIRLAQEVSTGNLVRVHI
ncbi:hypothetical protein CK501_16215 [Halovibrio salipaludis]|uniref:Uncharacterized protein n=1 Tax=Halovibrio salipaludis TaxID=2032626 RepID=A0A2A2EVD8_9GAMM|nr:hypothetical protein CK501_16215 [Halovibrio salipaludis]